MLGVGQMGKCKAGNLLHLALAEEVRLLPPTNLQSGHFGLCCSPADLAHRFMILHAYSDVAPPCQKLPG